MSASTVPPAQLGDPAAAVVDHPPAPRRRSDLVAATPPAPVGAPAPATVPSSPRPRAVRTLLLGVLSVAAALAVGLLLTGLAGGLVASGPSTAGLAVIVPTAVAVPVIWRVSRHSPRRAAWRTYGAGLVLALGGDAASSAWTEGDALDAVGAVGALVVLAGVLLMVDRRTWGTIRQRLFALTLFVDATALTGFCLLHVTGLWDRGPQDTTLPVLAGGLAIGALRLGTALLLAISCPPALRRVTGLLIGAELFQFAGWVLSATTHGPGGIALVHQQAAVGLAWTGLACAVTSVLADRATTSAPAPDGSRTTGSRITVLTATLPHLSAVVGGVMLLVDIRLTGELSPVGLTMAVLGLCSVAGHQVVATSAYERLTGDLARSEAYFRALARSSGTPVVILDERMRVSWTAPSLTDLLGPDAAALAGVPAADLVHPDDLPALLDGLLDPAGTDAASGRTRLARMRHTDGSWRLIEVTVRDLRDDPDVGAMVLYCRDVTGAPAPVAADEVRYTHEGTGLPNRAALVQRLGALLRRAPSDRDADPWAMISVRVNGVHDLVTDSPDVAVEARRLLIAHLARELRADDWLAMPSQGSYVVLLAGTVADAEALARRLVDGVGQVPAGRAGLTAQAGVLALEDGLDAAEVLRRADLALAGARASGPGCVRRYDDATRDEQDRLGALRDDLGHALERRELRLVYQPVVDLALHRVTGMEALMRWQHPRYGAVSPADFIPLAEESQLVVDLGRWALQEACTMLAGLPSDEQTVAVNIAPRHLRSGTLVPDVLGALHRSGLAPTRLVLEITESVLLDASGVVDDLAALRRLGIRVAVDDFGTGWSSLARLVNLPVDVLKMDRSFLSGLGDDPQRRALCRAVLELGNILGLSVIVEGVETPMEQSLLQNMGHRYLQGYLLGRPMEQVDLVGHLQAGGAAPSGQLPPAGRTS